MTKINKSYIKLLLLALKPNSSGYTLLESLMALVVVGILITSVAPMLALTTASRVQARRVDLATQAQRAYIDGVRGGALPIPQRFVVPNPNVNFIASLGYGFPPASSLVLGGNNYATIITSTIFPDPGTLVDTNGNGFSVDDPQDLVIQVIRPIATCTAGIPAVSAAPPAPAVPAVPPVFCPRNNDTERAAEVAEAKSQGFKMALRVFRADSFSGGNVPSGTEQANIFIGTIGSRQNPLVASVTQVFPSTDLKLDKFKLGITAP